MHVDLNKFINAGDTVAVALSGGSDSMALLHYMQSQAEKYRYFLVAINVEHGIRGQSSISDTEFVKEYCKNRSNHWTHQGKPQITEVYFAKRCQTNADGRKTAEYRWEHVCLGIQK